MNQSGEMNALLGLIAPWTIATGCTFHARTNDNRAGSPATTLNLVITFLASASLITYGITLEGSEAAIAGLIASGAGFIAGAILGPTIRNISRPSES